MTKFEKFEALKTVIATAEITETERAMFIEFLEKEMVSLVNRVTKDAARRAEKRAEDPLKDLVAKALTTEFQTAEEIMAVIGEDAPADITIAKVRARLTALITAGVATKESLKVEKKTKMAYKLAD